MSNKLSIISGILVLLISACVPGYQATNNQATQPILIAAAGDITATL